MNILFFMTFNFDDERAINVFKCIRWPDGVFCPECNSDDIYKKGKRSEKQRYRCNSCEINFNDFTGTPFHNREIPMSKIFYILFNVYKHEKMDDIANELGISRQTVNSIALDFKDFFKDEKSIIIDDTSENKTKHNSAKIFNF